MIYSTTAFAIFTAVASASTISGRDLKEKFDEFKLQYFKSYPTMLEEQNRFEIFAQNLQTAESRNLLEVR
jgi:hypothetical protein